jgi:phospholipid/cholesterol/gamma-HCH transport system substrate-binding protein
VIVRRTKIQLVIFALVTVLGGMFVGGRYAQIDRLVVDRTYTVTTHFADSGGSFEGAPVTYRGIEVGEVKSLTPERDGVRVDLAIENSAPKIPADLDALVANKSAIGEQYVDLRPRTASGPYLAQGTVIGKERTAIPVTSAELLIDVNSLVKSVDPDSLRTVVDELGRAFEGTGPDLARILDTTSSFIQTADDNIDVTRALIRNSDSVLQTQIDKRGAVAEFSTNLAKLSDTLVEADPDLRRLVDKGSEAARTLDAVVDENAPQLGAIVSDLRTVNAPLARNLPGLQSIFVLYPYLLSGTYSVLTPAGDDWNAAFGLALADQTPTCTYAKSGGQRSGYLQRRPDSAISDRELPEDIDCKVPNKIARQPSKTVFNRTAAGATGSWANLLLDPVSR